MIHSADHFWRHISRCSTRLLSIVVFSFSGNPKIGEPGIAIFLKYNIFGFQVAMDDILGMDIL